MHTFKFMSLCALSLALLGAASAASAASAAGADIQHCNQPMGTLALDTVPASSMAEMRRVIDQSNCFVIVDPKLEIGAAANRKAMASGLDYRTRRLGRFEWIIPDYTARVMPGAEQGSAPALTVSDNGADLHITIAATPAMRDAVLQR